MNKANNKKYDVNWCMQYLAALAGIVFLIVGFSSTTGFWSNAKEYYQIYIGIVFIIAGCMHRLQWLHKNDLIQAWSLRDEMLSNERKDKKKSHHVTIESGGVCDDLS